MPETWTGESSDEVFYGATTTRGIAQMDDLLLENPVVIEHQPDSRWGGGDCPVVFLGVGGVIVDNHAGLQLEMLQELARICSRTGASCVLSSDWRRRPELKKRVYEALERFNIRVLGSTNCNRPTNGPRERPLEILEWCAGAPPPSMPIPTPTATAFGPAHRRLQEHADSTEPRRWCAIDDRDLEAERGGELMRGRAVRCDRPKPEDPEAGYGLTAVKADEAIHVLSMPGSTDYGRGAAHLVEGQG